jgi:hypothetical protein
LIAHPAMIPSTSAIRMKRVSFLAMSTFRARTQAAGSTLVKRFTAADALR